MRNKQLCWIWLEFHVWCLLCIHPRVAVVWQRGEQRFVLSDDTETFQTLLAESLRIKPWWHLLCGGLAAGLANSFPVKLNFSTGKLITLSFLSSSKLCWASNIILPCAWLRIPCVRN